MKNSIKIIGAKGNNLKNINLKIPKNKFIVFTGVSGSGKSTLAFDTIYAEGQRRYLESLSSYARQFLDKVAKPDVEKIEGLTPTIAIDQKTTSKNPRSTVGTITEIYDYLRLLYSRVGEQFCHKCGKKISKMQVQDIIDEVNNLPSGAKCIIMSPLVKSKKGTFSDLLESFRLKGYVRAMIDGVIVRLDDDINLSKTKQHTIKIVVDRTIIKDENRQRVAQSVERALIESYGEIEIDVLNYKEANLKKSNFRFSEHLACFDCKVSFEPLEPLSFSFNSPKGACLSCGGLGARFSIDFDKVIDKTKSIDDGAIKILNRYKRGFYFKLFKSFCKKRRVDTTKNFNDLSKNIQNDIIYGSLDKVSIYWGKSPIQREWMGIARIVHEIYKDSTAQDRDLECYMSYRVCDVCGGDRLKQESLFVKVSDKTIGTLLRMPIEDVFSFFKEDKNFTYLSSYQKTIAAPILKEIKERLFFLVDVGLEYLTIGRDARSISGGEAQRIRIASQIGSGLTGVIYVLDEPSIGLHEKDTLKLIRTLKSLQDRGNTLIVVEHDRSTINAADYIVDIGPIAGENGGEIVFSGTLDEFKKTSTLTARYLSNELKCSFHVKREQIEWLEVKNICVNNIKNLSVKIPLRNFVCITGVSGSGKSSLMLQTLLPHIKQILNSSKKTSSINGVKFKGIDKIDKVIYLDQSPIGRTPRSNPATYTGVMSEIREIFARTKEARIRGYKIGRFSFNVKGGRCEKCKGEGDLRVEMHFLPDVLVKCDKCMGKKYNQETLEIRYKGKNIFEVLEMSVEESLQFFKPVNKLYQKLKMLHDVGLGYITLGQNAITLSGGEAQRIKIAKELSKTDTGNTFYMLDEPTTGLHFADVNHLILAIHKFVDNGNSVMIIEHNLDVIKSADYIIDMGLGGGNRGGKLVASGSPSSLILDYKKTKSLTAQALKEDSS